jgi:hypothetical protein
MGISGCGFNHGDLVALKLDLSGRVCRGMHLTAGTLRDRGVAVWRVVGFRYVFGQGRNMALLDLQSVAQSNISRVARVCEVTLLGASRAPCAVTRYAEGSQNAACWEVKHPVWGRRIAVRVPFDAKFLEKLKKLISSKDRRWRAGIWYINPRLRPLTEALFRMFFTGRKMRAARTRMVRKVTQAGG